MTSLNTLGACIPLYISNSILDFLICEIFWSKIINCDDHFVFNINPHKKYMCILVQPKERFQTVGSAENCDSILSWEDMRCDGLNELMIECYLAFVLCSNISVRLICSTYRL